MVTSFLKINLPLEKTKDAIQMVRSILGWTSAQAGCISMALYEDSNQPGTIMIFEEWADWPSLEKHIRSSVYRSILEVMELAAEPPQIKFGSVSDTNGLEVIERLRG